MQFDLYEKAKEKIIVVAHRGMFTGNIPCNTLPAYRIALAEGADMIEIDVDMSAEGKLYIFHPGMEKPFLGAPKRIPEMTNAEVEAQRYKNYDQTPTDYGLATFDEVMEEFKGKCFINVDKFWGHPEEIYHSIKRHGMEDQVLVKSAINEKVITVLKELAPDIAFMPIVSDTHPAHRELLASGINYIGAEALFYSDDAEVCSESFIDMMHRDGKLVWANSIIYNYKAQIAAGHSDDVSVIGNPELGWGWLAKRGFDFIQTDWVGVMTKYLDKSGLLYRNK
ncbi:MAG: glycerophosphodiester phosphodiesterase family protein [Clostridia bacterium]|nr:glycerophosphodiester phosphodiesterase family protein [Clostridia bacterium]